MLIIDDDKEDCDLFSDAMKIVDSEVECEKVFSSQNALELLNSEAYKPDFIFLDLSMPVVDGNVCLNEIGKIDAVKGIPVIIYTTSNRPRDIEYTKGSGAVHFITKPTSLNELCSEIALYLIRSGYRLTLLNAGYYYAIGSTPKK